MGAQPTIPLSAPPAAGSSVGSLARAALLIALVLAAATVAVAIVESVSGDLDGSPIYLVAVVIVATRLRTAAGIVTAIAAFVIYNLLFTDPRFTLVVSDPTEWLNLVLFLFVALVIGRLAGIGADRAAEAEARAAESAALYAITRTLATDDPDTALPAVARSLVSGAGMDRVWSVIDDGGTERTIADTGEGPIGPAPAMVRVLMTDRGDPAWMRTHGARPSAERRAAAAAGDHRFKVRLDADGEAIGALWATRRPDDPEPTRAQTRLLALAAAQVGVALGRERLRRQALAAEVARRDAALKSALVDSVSHDLRTPLAGIRAAAGTLADPAYNRTPDEVRATATLIEEETKRLDRMVGGLLDLSRIQAGEIKPDREALDVEDAVRSVLVRMASVVGPRRVKVTIAAGLPPVAGDAAFVDQCLANLVENVARHTPESATAWIRAHPLDDGAVGGVEIEVEDDGPGVDAEAARHLFERFYRGRAAGSGSGGMGIGLAIVRGLTEAMGGTVSAARGSAGGLLIRMRLPSMPPPAEDPAAP
ncbi:MAG TPA: ATP-binding protein [Candidatus Limnocylindrales bacterium]|jgi:two-component system sensor histidine kinase KdpD